VALEIHQHSQLQELLGILRRRIWQIVFPAAFVLSLGIAFTVFLPYKYGVQTEIEIRPVNVTSGQDLRGDQMAGLNRGFTDAILQIQHFERVRRVLEAQDWEDYVTLPRDLQIEYLRRVLSRIMVRTKGDMRDATSSKFVTIRYTDANPHRAEQFVNSLRDAYIEDVVERFRREAREERDELQSIKTERLLKMHEAQVALTELRREHGLPLIQTGQQRGDPLYERYQAAQEELSKTVRELESLQAELAKAQEQYDNEPEEMLEEVTEPGSYLKDDIVRMESDIVRLRTQLEGLRPAHSKYQLISAEIVRIQEEIEQLKRSERASVIEERFAINPLRQTLYAELGELRRQIEAENARRERLELEVATFRVENDRLSEVYGEVDKLQNEVSLRVEEYSEASTAYAQQAAFVQLISGPEGNPFELVEPGIAPSTPTEPNKLLLLLVSLAVGVGVGVGTALLAEYSRNCYRSVYDIARSMTVPVLGAINTVVTRAEARRLRFMRLIIGTSCFLIIGFILLLTWTWSSMPELLPPNWLQVIDDLRANFR
jgi:capsular polysaccharide biosynthesis protein